METGGGFKSLYEEATSRCSSVLSGDLMVEILQRLPVKSLVRFESTSKSWQFVIRSSKFIEKHLIYHQKHEQVKYLHQYKHVPDWAEDFQPFTLCHCPPWDPVMYTTEGIALISTRDDGSIITDALCHCPTFLQCLSIVNSSNGLVCVKFCCERNWDFYFGVRRFAIWNPATRKFKHLPTPPPSPVWKLLYIWKTIDCFSYIPRTCSYKLVQILFFEFYEQDNIRRYDVRVNVLNIGANSWREVVCQGQDEAGRDLCWEDESYEPTRAYRGNHPVMAKGCLHWLRMLRNGGKYVVSFDLDKEVFTQTAIPYFYDCYHLKLDVFRDNLALFVSLSRPRYDETDRYFEAWIYEGTSKSWAKGFSIGPLPGSEYPVGFWADGDIIIKSKFPYLYNPINKENKNLTCSDDFCNLAFEPYVESLVSF